MGRKTKPIAAFDCETDPFLYGRIPKPFIWGYYNGADFWHFDKTEEFHEFLREQETIAYAHNGGKFDFHFLTEWFELENITIINSRIVRVRIGKCELRDSYSIIPEPLKAFEKEVIDYSTFEAGERDKPKNRQRILTYLQSDCVGLYKLVDGFTKESGKKLTLASNALAHSKKLDIDPGKTGKSYDTTFRQFYAGGRCEAFKIGKFKNVRLYDIKSAYPFAMIHDHPTGDAYRVTDKIFDDEDRGKKCFFIVDCDSRGAFWKRDKAGLYFPHEKGIFHVTGWELYTAIEYGLCKINKVLATYEFYEHINFKAYIEHWFAIKEQADKAGNTLMRLLAKKMLNALYGKLAQNPENFFDYKLMPRDTDLEKGWAIHAETPHWELHARAREPHMREKFGDGYETYPQFFNVATAASITGFVRSILIRGMANAGPNSILYCDTDSLFVGPSGNNIGVVPTSLGDFGNDGLANEIYIAGKKLYAARLSDGKFKIATKGVKLQNNRNIGAHTDAEVFQQIKSLTEGGQVEWASPAPNFRLGKSPEFVVRKIAANSRRKVERKIWPKRTR